MYLTLTYFSIICTSVYRFLISRQRFIQYMTVCVDNYDTGACLTQLQKQKLLGAVHTYTSSTTVHHHVSHSKTVNYGISITDHKFVYRGHGKH